MRRRHLLWVVAALLALAGAVILGWQRMDDEAAAREQQLAAEADLRGKAVSTLTGDVRVLRAQLQAAGKTPAVPDPEQAVEDLPERAEVPVSIPGEPGQPGRDGAPGSAGEDGLDGSDGADGTPGADGSPGADGVDGRDGAPGEKGDPGEKGEKGDKGEPGERGPEGPAGASCEDGYSWQTPDYDPDARICRKNGAPPPDSPGLLSSAALDPNRRQYP
ncbi:collagen-like protein [Streptomyces sp. V1I1]|uniref:collagen-like protein n=1 Tax=Streptomyces sp. V1I1 TaxID=3042272 RepID=UPI002785DA55|nr:collagen-like protein [Streptomyces sp. V1I1]MDQ0943258.1 outer membrane murein-binding lipoprotein Lpp [Streptomyces sp. V1I1]